MFVVVAFLMFAGLAVLTLMDRVRRRGKKKEPESEAW